MIPEAIRAAFRWWAKHPWMTFWGITPLVLLIIIIPLGNDLLDFAYPICLPVLVIAWILSFSRGVFVTWQRSQDRAVLAVASLAITSIIIILTIPMIFGHHQSRNPDAAVRTNIKNAATAQETPLFCLCLLAVLDWK